jgi:hypothetical protein
VLLLSSEVGWLLTLTVFLARALTTRSRPNRPKVAYLLTTVLLYGLSTGPDQDFLLLSVLITVFYNVQHLGLVWFYNRNRYGQAMPAVGPAWWINRSLGRFLGVCGLFSVVYLLFACWADVFPGCRISTFTLGTITASQIGLCLWWGLALQHHCLDQRTWRLSADAPLRRHLKLV